MADAYPSLPRLTVESDSADFAALRAAAPRLKRGILAQGVEYIVTDFLAILGNLTGDMLSKGLHAKLAAVRLKPRSRD